ARAQERVAPGRRRRELAVAGVAQPVAARADEDVVLAVPVEVALDQERVVDVGGGADVAAIEEPQAVGADDGAAVDGEVGADRGRSQVVRHARARTAGARVAEAVPARLDLAERVAAVAGALVAVVA